MKTTRIAQSISHCIREDHTEKERIKVDQGRKEKSGIYSIDVIATIA
jgi:hypothetical protein